MDGLVMLLASDLRQTLPTITKEAPANELNLCLKSSYLWDSVFKIDLTTNMKIQLYNDMSALEFTAELLNMEMADSSGKVCLHNFCSSVQNPDFLNENAFPNSKKTFFVWRMAL